jgi:hypothetical protein
MRLGVMRIHGQHFTCHRSGVRLCLIPIAVLDVACHSSGRRHMSLVTRDSSVLLGLVIGAYKCGAPCKVEIRGEHMTKQSKISLVIGAAILAVGAFTSGTASAIPCSAAGSTKLADVTVSTSNPSVCIRTITNFPLPPGIASCWDVAKSAGLSCVNPVTGMVNIISVATP